MGIFKQERIGEIRLERKILRRRDLLLLKRNLCNGCGLCIVGCPKEALWVKSAVTKDGNLLHFPIIAIDETKCIICGICAVLCPLGALEAWVNDKKSAMFLENDAIPSMIRGININKDLCNPNCMMKCEKSCPRDAIRAAVEMEDGQVKKIIDVQVDTTLCVYCKACEYACPYGLITVEKPLEGSVSFDIENCPPNCRICIDICPSKAIYLEEMNLKVRKEFCIFCKACETVCPKEAAHVNIRRVFHTPITSANWINILERFASYMVATKELAILASSKRKSVINRFIK